MRVLLVQPLGDSFRSAGVVRNYVNLEPISLQYLASSAVAAGHEVSIRHPILTDAEFKNVLLSEKPDVLGLSVYTFSLSMSLRFARIARDMLPGVRIVFGGYHPTVEPGDCLGPEAADVVVAGEGEDTFVELLDAMSRESPLDEVPGLVFLRGAGLLKTPSRPRNMDQDRLPFPSRSRHLTTKARCYQVIYPPPSRQTGMAQMLSSRGCPHNCDYCISPRFWQGKVSWRSPIRVLDEIEYLRDNFGVKLFYFIDLAMNNSRRHLMALADEFVRRAPGVHWYGLFNPDVYDTEMLHALKASGCVKVSVGVEGADPVGFRRLKGEQWRGLDEAAEFIRAAWDVGLITRTFMMIGNQWDSAGYYERISDFLTSVPIDDTRLVFTVPFPGTPLFESLNTKDALITSDYSRFTTQEPIIRSRLAPEEQISAQQQILSEFYASKKYHARVNERCKAFPEYRDSYIEHMQFLQNQCDVGHSLREALHQAETSLTSTAQPCML